MNLSQADKILSIDLQLFAKEGIKNTAIALSETSTPYVRDALTRMFLAGLQTHARTFTFNLMQGVTPTYRPEQLIRNDFLNARYALAMPVQLRG